MGGVAFTVPPPPPLDLDDSFPQPPPEIEILLNDNEHAGFVDDVQGFEGVNYAPPSDYDDDEVEEATDA